MFIELLPLHVPQKKPCILFEGAKHTHVVNICIRSFSRYHQKEKIRLLVKITTVHILPTKLRFPEKSTKEVSYGRKKVCKDDYLRSSSRSITTCRWRGGNVSALFHWEPRWRIISNVISEHKNTYERRIIDTYMCGVVSKVDDIDDINNM